MSQTFDSLAEFLVVVINTKNSPKSWNLSKRQHYVCWYIKPHKTKRTFNIKNKMVSVLIICFEEDIKMNFLTFILQNEINYIT